jgi:hypothetical protein
MKKLLRLCFYTYLTTILKLLEVTHVMGKIVRTKQMKTITFLFNKLSVPL